MRGKEKSPTGIAGQSGANVVHLFINNNQQFKLPTPKKQAQHGGLAQEVNCKALALAVRMNDQEQTDSSRRVLEWVRACFKEEVAKYDS